jgi:hypothetical protein
MLTISMQRRKRAEPGVVKSRAESAILGDVKRPRAAAVLGRITLAALVSAMLAVSAFAQDVSVPMPNEYGGAPGTMASPDQIPDPTAILNDDGSSFAIPIPGGGEIQVQGPQSDSPHTIAPTENWATQRNTPFSVGGTPMGPVPATR